MRRIMFGSAAALVLVGILGTTATLRADEPPSAGQDGSAAEWSTPNIDMARHLFYSGRYADAAAMAEAIRSRAPEDLSTFELRTSALHFQLRRALGEPKDKDKAFKACAECPGLLKVFVNDITEGRRIAKARLAADEHDLDALFYQGKLDLNYVWLQLGTLGRRTGWGEYREARHSLDDVLDANPDHVRARVARAWIDYIVDTKVSWAFRWILGGGDKKKALAVMNDAAATATDRFDRIEARFGLWEMNIREKKMPEALAVARDLARDFPDNHELQKFITTQTTLATSSLHE